MTGRWSGSRGSHAMRSPGCEYKDVGWFISVGDGPSKSSVVVAGYGVPSHMNDT